MQRVSRRQFLHVSGIALLSTSLDSLGKLAVDAPLYGRALTTAPVYRADGVVVTRLWHNSVYRILEILPDAYRLADGLVERVLLQPMLLQPAAVTAEPAPPFLAEVAGPVAVLRRACAADADIVTTVGHGGVLHVVTALPDGSGGIDWYGVAGSPGSQIGWTQARAWRPVQPDPPPTRTDRTLTIDLRARTLSADEAGQPVLDAAITTTRAARPGAYTLADRQPSTAAAGYAGVPWVLHLNGADHLELAGVYWHNQFGTGADDGPAVQVPPLLARWLYDWLPTGARIMLR